MENRAFKLDEYMERVGYSGPVQTTGDTFEAIRRNRIAGVEGHEGAVSDMIPSGSVPESTLTLGFPKKPAAADFLAQRGDPPGQGVESRSPSRLPWFPR